MENNTRYLIIDYSIIIESKINKILATHLEILEPKKSLSFSTKSSALSYMAKVNLLYDLKLINKEDVAQFQLIGEIRNKFAHLNIKTFSELMEENTNIRDRFIKMSQNKNSPLDEHFYVGSFLNIYDSNINNLKKIIHNHTNNLYQKFIKELSYVHFLEILISENPIKSLLEYLVIKDNNKELSDFINEELKSIDAIKENNSELLSSICSDSK